jgi:hypothetical protein
MPNNPNHMQNLKPFKEGYDSKRDGSGRKPKKFMTELLIKALKSKEEITIEGIDTVTGLPAKIRVSVPTQKQIVHALLREADKGNVYAIKEIIDRVEGKTPQALNFQDSEGNTVPIQLIFQAAPGNEPLLENE